MIVVDAAGCKSVILIAHFPFDTGSILSDTRIICFWCLPDFVLILLSFATEPELEPYSPHFSELMHQCQPLLLKHRSPVSLHPSANPTSGLIHREDDRVLFVQQKVVFQEQHIHLVFDL